jgi:hypothetical protein
MRSVPFAKRSAADFGLSKGLQIMLKLVAGFDNLPDCDLVGGLRSCADFGYLAYKRQKLSSLRVSNEWIVLVCENTCKIWYCGFAPRMLLNAMTVSP